MNLVCSCGGGYLLFIGILITTSLTSASNWDYNDQNEWGGECTKGRKQSPINLEYSSSVPGDYVSFKFTDYDILYKGNLTNNGHTVKINFYKGTSTPKISGGGLPDVYVLEEVHFHWSSEHTINGERFPLEAHLVHYAEKYGNLDNAKLYQSGVAVLGVLFHISLDVEETLEPILQFLPMIEKDPGGGASVIQSTRGAALFLPRDRAGYYRYEGSLTTPNCNEGVIWTIFTETLPISESQVAQFRKIWTEHKVALTSNYRDTQDLNSRKVYLRESPVKRSAASVLNIPLIGYVVLIAFGVKYAA